MLRDFLAELATARRFLTVGAITTLLDYAIFSALIEQAQWPVAAANATSYSAGIVLSLALHRRWTFRRLIQPNHAGRDAAKFIAWNMAALVLSTALVQLGTKILSPEIAKLGSIAIMAALNFLVARFWVFSPPPRSHVRL